MSKRYRRIAMSKEHQQIRATAMQMALAYATAKAEAFEGDLLALATDIADFILGDEQRVITPTLKLVTKPKQEK